MTPVTDPALLSQLNGPQPVTDPSVLAQLNGSQDAPGFTTRVGDDWSRRLQSVPTSLAADQTMPETALQLTGQVAGAAGDVAGEAVKSLTPQPYVDAAHTAANAIDQTPVGQRFGDALLAGRDAVTSLADAHPRLARDAAAVGNILGLGIGAGTAGAVEGTGAKLGLGEALYNSGKASQDAARQQFVQELVLPKQTPSVKADMALRTKQIDGTNVYQPAADEQRVAATVAGVPGVSPKNSTVRNLNLVQEANTQEAEALKARLQQNDVPIPDDTIVDTLAAVHRGLADNPYVSGADASKAAGSVVNKALDIITSMPQTASSMLDARKELDRWVASQKGDKAFNPALDSPITTAVQQVRQAMNKMVADAVPQADVLESLRKQSNLYDAADNIAPKAANEAPTSLGRLVQRFTPSNVAEGAKGVGALLAAKEILPHVPPSLLATGLAGYGVYKGVTSPATRIALGKALGVSNVP